MLNTSSWCGLLRFPVRISDTVQSSSRPWLLGCQSCLLLLLSLKVRVRIRFSGVITLILLTSLSLCVTVSFSALLSRPSYSAGFFLILSRISETRDTRQVFLCVLSRSFQCAFTVCLSILTVSEHLSGRLSVSLSSVPLSSTRKHFLNTPLHFFVLVSHYSAITSLCLMFHVSFIHPLFLSLSLFPSLRPLPLLAKCCFDH